MEALRKVDSKGRLVLPKAALLALRVKAEDAVVVYVAEGPSDPPHVELWNPRRWYGR